MSASAVSSHEGLLFTVFQQLRQGADRGVAVAFTSANAGDGVTHTLDSLLRGFDGETDARTLAVDSRRLRMLTCPPEEVLDLCRGDEGVIAELADPLTFEAGPHSWEGSWEYRRDVLDRLRLAFDYVLIDCPALREANDLLALAPFVDGVILVVAAGQTRRDQIVHAEKSIGFARGRLLGHILNKRTYAVPDWIYRRL